jgi:hypothetical protein
MREIAYFGADLCGARCAAVVPLGTTLGGGVASGAAVDGGSTDIGVYWMSFAASSCVSEAAGADNDISAVMGTLRRALRLTCEDIVFFDGRFVPDLVADDARHAPAPPELGAPAGGRK